MLKFTGYHLLEFQEQFITKMQNAINQKPSKLQLYNINTDHGGQN